MTCIQIWKRRTIVKIFVSAVVLAILSLNIFFTYFTFCMENVPDWSWMLKQRSPMHVYVRPEEDTLLIAPQPHFCTGDPLLVIMVCSGVDRFENRKAIRETWASKLPDDVRIVFVVGKPLDSAVSSETTARLQLESRDYGDIVQEDFDDTYRNLTIKTVMLLKWRDKHCSRAKHVLKADDDVFIHMDNLMHLLRTSTDPNLFFGFRFNFNTRYFTCFAKNYLPHAIYNDIVFPKFFYGPSYLMSRNVADLLYPVALRTEFFYVEDLFLTGTCSEEIKIERRDHEGFLYFSRWNDRCRFREKMITVHLKENADRKMRKFWNLMNDPELECTPELMEYVIS